jgi:hypothetical protein
MAERERERGRVRQEGRDLGREGGSWEEARRRKEGWIAALRA